MPVLVRMAFRNLFAHRAKTLIVGTLIALGVLILVTGLSSMETADRGLQRSFVQDFTGNVMIGGRSEGANSVFGVTSPGGSEKTPILPRSEEIVSWVRAQPEVDRVTTQVTGASQITLDGAATTATSLVFLFGVEPQSYHAMFDAVDLVSGSYLRPGEPGILISQPQIEKLNSKLKADIKAGDTIILQNFGTAIRAVTVRGIFRFKRPQTALDLVSYVDAPTLSALEGIGAGETAPAWHFVLVNLKDPSTAPGFIGKANQWLASQGIDARAAGWKQAAGPYAVIPSVIRAVFLVAVLIVSAVTAIIIMNTLVASVIERTGEIGTMRAMGAGKAFVWIMLLLETLVISVLFGLVGIAAAAGVLGILNTVGIQTANSILRLLIGGSVLRPVVSLSAVGASLIVVLVIGVLSHLYPVLVALRVRPIRAIRAGQDD